MINEQKIGALKVWYAIFTMFMDERDEHKLSNAQLITKLKQLRKQIAVEAPGLEAAIRKLKLEGGV